MTQLAPPIVQVDFLVAHFPLERFGTCTCKAHIYHPRGGGSWNSGEWERAWATHLVAEMAKAKPSYQTFEQFLNGEGRRATPAGYRAWRESGDGYKAFATLERLAVEQFHGTNGARKRISINALVEKVRDIWKIHINNTYRAWIADELIRRHPDMASVIVRRKRVKVGPV